jgi:6,7-dimethyl-8-ribityllumazine synthase
MPMTIQGSLDASGLRFALVASRFNQDACDRLLQAALATLRERGAADDSLTVVRVPGAWEIPAAAAALARGGRLDVILALGVLIRGETRHFDLIAAETSRALQSVVLETGVPIAFGILAAESAAQVEARTGGALGNRGAETAVAAIEMARVRRALAAS